MGSLIRRMIDRLRNEPVMLVTAAIIALTAFQSAVSSGLSLDDAALAVIQALLGWVAREFVFSPATHEADVAAAFDAGFERGRFPSGH